MKLKVFISSVQKEFHEVRMRPKAFLVGDAVLHRFISEVFLFEELPAKRPSCRRGLPRSGETL